MLITRLMSGPLVRPEEVSLETFGSPNSVTLDVTNASGVLRYSPDCVDTCVIYVQRLTIRGNIVSSEVETSSPGATSTFRTALPGWIFYFPR